MFDDPFAYFLADPGHLATPRPVPTCRFGVQHTAWNSSLQNSRLLKLRDDSPSFPAERAPAEFLPNGSPPLAGSVLASRDMHILPQVARWPSPNTEDRRLSQHRKQSKTRPRSRSKAPLRSRYVHTHVHDDVMILSYQPTIPSGVGGEAEHLCRGTKERIMHSTSRSALKLNILAQTSRKHEKCTEPQC